MRQPERWDAPDRTLRVTVADWHSLDQPDESAAGLQPRTKETKSCRLGQSAPEGVPSSALVVSKALHLPPKILAVPQIPGILTGYDDSDRIRVDDACKDGKVHTGDTDD